MIGDDLAGQSGPLFRPDFYRRVVKPRHKQLVQYITLADQGKDLVPHLRRLHELHPRPAGQRRSTSSIPCRSAPRTWTPAQLKAEFGDRLVFWGGAIDAQHVLPPRRPKTVREHVRRNIEAFKPGGGYVFNNVHNIQAGVPPENVVAMYDAAYEFGFYE